MPGHIESVAGEQPQRAPADKLFEIPHKVRNEAGLKASVPNGHSLRRTATPTRPLTYLEERGGP